MRKIIPIILPVLILLFTSRCTLPEDIEKLTNTLDSLSLVIGTPEFGTGIQLEFINIKTGDYIDDSQLNVVVSGTHASKVYNNLGEKEATYTSGFGIMELIIDPKAVDTVAMQTIPVEFDITVSGNGYNTITQRIQLYKAGMLPVTVGLIKLADAPQGVSVAQRSNFVTTNSSGVTTQSNTIALNSGDHSITVNNGVLLKDENGNPVSGSLSAEVIYFDPTSQEAQNAFPGGLNVTARMEDNTNEQIEFVSAGMFDVRLSAGGKNVKTFEGGGLTLKTTVPETLINPNTGLPMKENDVIELWSVDEGSGEWVFEKMDTVRKVNGKLVLEETVTHLSRWNWDFFRRTCFRGPQIVFRGKTNHMYNVQMKYRYSNSNIFQYRNYSMFNNNRLEFPTYFYNTPTNTTGYYTFSDETRSAYRKLTFNPSTLTINNLCGGIFYVDITEQITASTPTVQINLNLSARSGITIIQPTLTLRYRVIGSTGLYNSLNVINGKGSFTLELDKPYYLLATLGSNQGKGTLIIENFDANRYRITVTPINMDNNNPGTPITYFASKTSNGSASVQYTINVNSSLFGKMSTRTSF